MRRSIFLSSGVSSPSKSSSSVMFTDMFSLLLGLLSESKGFGGVGGVLVFLVWLLPPEGVLMLTVSETNDRTLG